MDSLAPEDVGEVTHDKWARCLFSQASFLEEEQSKTTELKKATVNWDHILPLTGLSNSAFWHPVDYCRY